MKHDKAPSANVQQRSTQALTLPSTRSQNGKNVQRPATPLQRSASSTVGSCTSSSVLGESEHVEHAR